jgi:hypothetical protein
MAIKRMLMIGGIDFNRPVTKRFIELQIPPALSILPRLPLFHGTIPYPAP